MQFNKNLQTFHYSAFFSTVKKFSLGSVYTAEFVFRIAKLKVVLLPKRNGLIQIPKEKLLPYKKNRRIDTARTNVGMASKTNGSAGIILHVLPSLHVLHLLSNCC